MDITTREDVLACFRLLLGRQPSAEETPGHLGFVNAPLDSVVASYLQSLEFRNRGLLKPSSEAELVTLDGYSIYVAKDDALIAPSIRIGYEAAVTEVFLAHLGKGAAIDIGANCGHFSLLAASRGATVYAFEPLQKNLRLLHASVALNGFEKVKIFAAAASDAPRTLTIGAAYTNGIVGEPGHDAAAALGADFVAAVRIDDCVPSDATISVLKIDVEGHEYPALLGAMQTLKRCRPAIISEFSPSALIANSGHTASAYLELLFGLGYQVSVIGNPHANTMDKILEACVGIDHVDILAVAR